ncbi:hypothetical protein [Klebsiella pneumoniae]|uniref:hypothetical protein n=1 Tax=Klebsiella pneumoniae TaxID=573 RepID=UPI000AA33FEE
MTDITELAQREKFEAWFKSSFHPDKTGPYIKDQLYFAWKAASAELVEALEKAQRYIEELREFNAGLAQESFERQQLISELEPIRAAAEKLVRCKGRYHSEQNYRALAALFGVNTPDLPPLDDESHAVTVENLQESAYRAGLTAGWNLGLANDNDGFNKCLAAHAAGIKVEAE